jgi:hypothetical protein
VVEILKHFSASKFTNTLMKTLETCQTQKLYCLHLFLILAFPSIYRQESQWHAEVINCLKLNQNPYIRLYISRSAICPMTQEVSHPSVVDMEFTMEKNAVRQNFFQVLQHSIPVSSLQVSTVYFLSLHSHTTVNYMFNNVFQLQVLHYIK